MLSFNHFSNSSKIFLSMADSKVGVCYVWLISSLLFIFTISGAVFLVLFIMQPTSPTTSSYPIIGVSLVCFPWVFWFLTILYRIISRACGFRMICFGSHGGDQSDHNISLGGRTTDDNGPTHNASLPPTNDFSGGGNLVNENVNENGSENRASGVGSPRRVHFGGVVVLGEDVGGASENRGRSDSLPSPSSSSSSSNKGDESETPLKLSMA